MGCHTVYVIREGGRLSATGLKYGQDEFASPAEVRETFERLRDRQWTVSSAIESTWCSGWYVDFDARVARAYRCRCGRDDDPCGFERRLRGEPGWAGWDVGVAWERSSEISALAGLPPRGDGYLARLDRWIGCTEHGLYTAHPDPHRFVHRWDRQANRIEYSFFYESVWTLVTLIDERERVFDYGFEDPVLFEALGHGPGIIEVLGVHAPLPWLDNAQSGAVIDAGERTVRLWGEETITDATWTELRRRWPGWTVERERAELEGHLQRTGRGTSGAEGSRRSFEYVEDVGGVEVPPPAVPEDEARLLARIAEDLDDDAPREVYADLLLEKGNPRGKFIQASLELSRLEAAGERSSRRRALETETRRLQGMYMRDQIGASIHGYQRGFVAHIGAELPALTQWNILDQHPTVDRLRLRPRLDSDGVRVLAGLAGVGRLRSLDVAPLAGAVDELARVLPQLRRLTIEGSLSRQGPTMADPAVARELAAVLAAGAFPHLEALVLRQCRFGTPELVAIVDALPSGVHTLGLHQGLHGDEATELASCSRLASIRRLELASIGREGALALAASPHLAGLRAWSQGSPIDGSELLARLPGVRELAVLYNGLGADELGPLAQSPELARLELLALRDIGCPDVLAASPHLDGLAELRIDSPGDAPKYAALRERLGDRLHFTCY